VTVPDAFQLAQSLAKPYLTVCQENTMAKARPTVQKRAKETARMEKKMQKAARKARREEEREERLTSPSEHDDPDIAGIVPGPQPVQEWDESEFELP